MKQNENEDQLIELAKAGNLNAFAKLINQYQQMVFVIASRILKNKQDAEDATQDVFIKCYENLSKFSGQSKFSSWLYRITYNYCLDRIKKVRNIHFDNITSIELNLTEYEIDHELEQDQKVIIKRSMNDLPEKYKLVLSMFYYQNRSYKNIAETIDETMANVKVMLFRAKKMLKVRLDKTAEFGV